MLYCLSAPWVFNTQNRLFSSACSFARKYAKIRNLSFSDTSLRSPAVEAPRVRNFATMCHKCTLIFLRKLALERNFHGKEMEFHGMDGPMDRMDAQKSRMETRESRWNAGVAECPL